MGISVFQGDVLFHFIRKHKELKIQHYKQVGQESCFILNGKTAILIKYRNTSDPIKDFPITTKEAITLLKLEKQFPNQTYLILNAGNEFKCSLNFNQIFLLCGNASSGKNKIFVEKDEYETLIVTGTSGQLEKGISINQYLKIL